MKRNYKLFVKDILDGMQKIDEFIASMDLEKFKEDDNRGSRQEYPKTD